MVTFTLNKNIKQNEIPKNLLLNNPGKILFRSQKISYTAHNSELDSLRENDNNYYNKYTDSSFSKSALPIHGFVGMCFDAYNNHHNLIIRPEDVWMAIVTQLAFYINARSEQLRTTLVNHKNTKKLKVTIMECSFTVASRCMGELLRQNITDPTLIDFILPDFSTTTDNDKDIFSMIAMATFKSYFSYIFHFMCGIPQVTLLGTKEDWMKLRQRANRLLEFKIPDENQLERWTEILFPTLNQFVNTFDSPDLDWWSKMCSRTSFGSGAESIQGWLIAFNAFNEDGKFLYIRKSTKEKNDYPIVEIDSIVSCTITNNVHVIDDTRGEEYDCELHSGIIAADVVNDNSLQSRMDWIIELIN